MVHFEVRRGVKGAALVGALVLASACGGPPVRAPQRDVQTLPPGFAPVALAAAGTGAWVAGTTLGPVKVGSATLTPRGGAVLLGLDLAKGITLAQGIGGTGPVRFTALRAGADGDVWAAGEFSVQVALGKGLLDTAGGHDCFFVRFDPLGNVRWATRFGGPGDEHCADLVPLDDGAWVVGDFGLPVDPPGPDAPGLESRGGRDLFVLKLSGEGVVEAALRLGGAGDEAAVSIDAAGSGVAVAGTFTADFQVGVSRMGVPIGGPGAFVAGIRGDLLPLWGRVLGDTGTTLRSVRATTDGGWAVAGVMDGVATVVRLNPGGSSAWRRDLPGWATADALDRDGSDLLLSGSGAGVRLARVAADGTIVAQWQCGTGTDRVVGVAGRPDGAVWFGAEMSGDSACAPGGPVLGRWPGL